MIEQNTGGNGRLKQEIAYQQRKQGLGLYLLEEVRLVVEKLQQAVTEYQRLQTTIFHKPSEDR
jgi:hypothetical protein